jgi:hypothetical protein
MAVVQYVSAVRRSWLLFNLHFKKKFKESTQSTNIPTAPQCLSPRPNWDPTPSPAMIVFLPREQRGGGHTRLRVRAEGWGSPN